MRPDEYLDEDIEVCRGQGPDALGARRVHRLGDLSPGERRVFISEAKGGHQRRIPVSAQFLTAVGDYLDRERAQVDHERLFVVLRGPTRCRLLSADGLDEILDGVKRRTGLPRLTCH